MDAAALQTQLTKIAQQLNECFLINVFSQASHLSLFISFISRIKVTICLLLHVFIFQWNI